MISVPSVVSLLWLGCGRACVCFGFVCLFISLPFTRQFCFLGEGNLSVACRRLSALLTVRLFGCVEFRRSFALRSFSCSFFLAFIQFLLFGLGVICCIIILTPFKVRKCIKTQRVARFLRFNIKKSLHSIGGFSFALWTKNKNKILCNCVCCCF